MIGTRLGDYEILHALKSGGMGDVLLARRRGPAGFEQLCAIKTVRAELATTPLARAMFLDEARLLARLSHPAIAQIIDFGEADGGTAYMVMEYVAGMSFRALGERQAPPPVLCQAVAAACRGLHAAHELRDLIDGHLLGVVHRDISPDNLMLGYDARVKVLDFGIALVRGRQAPVTEFGTLKGKPPYMSPEQLKNQPIDRRSDVFSTAVVLWELVTGRRLFTGDSIYAVAKAVEEQPIVAPSRLVPGLPDGLDDVILAGLARDPAQRLATAAAMAEVLERIAAAAHRDSLEVWAEQALADERDHHRRWLAGVLGLGRTAAVAGRPSGVSTALDGELPDGDATAGPAPDRGPTAVGTGAVTGPAPRADADAHAGLDLPARPRRRRALAALALIVVAGSGGGLWLATRGHAAAGAVAPDAAVVAVDAAERLDAGLALADAAEVPGALDAAPPIDARARGRDGGRGPIDAGRPPAVDAAPAAAVPVDAAVATGYLAVGTWSPAAVVVVDGDSWRETPVLPRKIAVGEHTVVLLRPLDRVEIFRTKVRVEAGKTVRVQPP
ncbi:MAG: serine/threonine protein kinase [Myxococcales bacterium]|nr:serine/threonine protein kinase [Myxococcales bacterium]